MIEYACGSPERLPEMKRLWKEAFGDDDGFIRSFFTAAYDPGRCRVALREGTVQGMLFWFDCMMDGKRIAYLYGVATAAEAQGQGIASGLLENVHSLLATCGYFGVMLVPASAELSRFYEKRGYRFAGGICHGCTPAAGCLPAQQIPAEEYLSLRGAMLPRGGLLQKNAAFLEVLAQCYRGDGYLAAVSREDSGRCLEFLGDPSRIAGFAGWLGCGELRWRMPGTDHPFVMGLRLDGEAWTEAAYLGLAFD